MNQTNKPHYKIVKASNWSALELKVNHYMQMGYWPCGTVAANAGKAIQPMVYDPQVELVQLDDGALARAGLSLDEPTEN